MITKDSNKKESKNDRSQNSKVGNTITNKHTSESQKRDLKEEQNKGNRKEKVDRKTVLSDLNEKK